MGMVSRIGRLAGGSPKKNGAVGCMARVARIRAVVASAAPSAHQASRTTATLDLPTGWQAGASPRRLGAVRTRARAAHQQLEDVLETMVGHCCGAPGLQLACPSERR